MFIWNLRCKKYKKFYNFEFFLFLWRVQSTKKKRSLGGIQNLFVEYLVVIDNTVYNNFLLNYGNIPKTLLTDYINIFFSQIVNGVSNRTTKN